jgi:hypothetical protein
MRRVVSHKGKFALLQIITLTQSWASLLATLAILIVPLAYGANDNVMILLLGIQIFLFQISSIQWQEKLLRLGSRIIGVKFKPRLQSGNQHSEEDLLAKQDFLLKLLVLSIKIAILFQLICLCVLAMVFPTDTTWLSLGIGMLAYFTLASVLTFVYQYQRCKTAILAAKKHVEATMMAYVSEDVSTSVAVAKFKKHQIIQLLTGLPATVILLLWSIEVIPPSFWLTIFTVLCDTLVSGTMLSTFMGKSPRDPSKQRVNNGSIVMGSVVIGSDTNLAMGNASSVASFKS